MNKRGLVPRFSLAPSIGIRARQCPTMAGIFCLPGHTDAMTPSDLRRFFGFGLATAAPRGVISLLHRYQRALLYVGGAVTSLVLMAATAVMLSSQVRDYVVERQAEFAARRALLHLELFVRQGSVRINIFHEEGAWKRRARAPQSLVDTFAAHNGRLVLPSNKDFPPMLLLGSLSIKLTARQAMMNSRSSSFKSVLIPRLRLICVRWTMT